MKKDPFIPLSLLAHQNDQHGKDTCSVESCPLSALSLPRHVCYAAAMRVLPLTDGL
jgi:hypothetical protein